jgi:hypothetical protein
VFRVPQRHSNATPTSLQRHSNVTPTSLQTLIATLRHSKTLHATLRHSKTLHATLRHSKTLHATLRHSSSAARMVPCNGERCGWSLPQRCGNAVVVGGPLMLPPWHRCHSGWPTRVAIVSSSRRMAHLRCDERDVRLVVPNIQHCNGRVRQLLERLSVLGGTVVLRAHFALQSLTANPITMSVFSVPTTWMTPAPTTWLPPPTPTTWLTPHAPTTLSV